jgi:hypothetical protein
LLKALDAAAPPGRGGPASWLRRSADRRRERALPTG